MVSTHLKNTRQIGLFPQVGVKKTYIWNHHLEIYLGDVQKQNEWKVRNTYKEPMDSVSGTWSGKIENEICPNCIRMCPYTMLA